MCVHRRALYLSFGGVHKTLHCHADLFMLSHQKDRQSLFFLFMQNGAADQQQTICADLWAVEEEILDYLSKNSNNVKIPTLLETKVQNCLIKIKK